MVSIPDSIVRSVKFSAPARGPPEPELKFTAQEVSPAGIVRLVICVFEMKEYPNLVNLEGSVTDSNASHPENTRLPISVTVLEIITLVRARLSAKALSEILVTV